MPQVINTNIASLNAQRNLDRSQGDANVALQRLSSGLRINSAKDDAAGLAISTRFESQISGLNVASRNANDGISLAQTTEGALDEVIGNLQRIRELAIQSANATNSPSDRAALDQEVQQRIEEIDRIGKQTTFNGLKVLDGSFGSQQFQVGANAGDTIEVSLNKGARSADIGAIASVDGLQVDSISGGNFTLALGDADPVTINIASGASAQTIAETMEGKNIAGLELVEAENVQDISFTNITTAAGQEATYTLSITVGDNNTVNVNIPISSGGTLDKATVADAVSSAGIDGLNVIESSAGIEFTVASGENLTIAESSTGTFASGDGLADAEVGTLQGQLSINATEAFNISDGSNLIGGDRSELREGSLEELNIKTVEAATNAIIRIDASLDYINGIRSELGAVQNRFESTIANLATTSENLSASNSRIKDADFAKETAELARTQVLQQAGLSVLTQANARPQQVLQLLQG